MISRCFKFRSLHLCRFKFRSFKYQRSLFLISPLGIYLSEFYLLEFYLDVSFLEICLEMCSFKISSLDISSFEIDLFEIAYLF